MKDERVTITPHQNYTLLNFHPSQVIEEIQRWLEDEEAAALTLMGEPSSGRSYALEAACFEQQFRSKPYVIATLDWSKISSGDAFGYLKTCIKDLVDSEQEQESWLELIASTLDSKFTIPAAIGASLVVNVGGLLKIARKLLPAFKLELIELDPKDVYTALRRLIQTLSVDQHLVLHIKHAELLSNPDTWCLDDVCRTLNRRACSLQGQPNDPGRVLLAFSTTEELGIGGEQSSLAQLKDPWQIAIKPINYYQFDEVFKARFSPNLFATGLFSPFGSIGLKRWFNKNLRLNPLNTRFIDLIHGFANLQDDDNYYQPSLLRNVFAELLGDGLLKKEDGYWQLNPSATEEEISNVLGHPVRKWNATLLKKVDQSLCPAVESFLQLAALCDPVIPWEPLVQYVSNKQGINQEKLITTLREFWFIEPALLKEIVEDEVTDQKSSWRYSNPLLAIAERPERISVAAQGLLEWLLEQLPNNDRQYAGLFLQLASWAGETQYAEWRFKLNWWVEEECAPLLKYWLVQQLMTHQMQVDSQLLSNMEFIAGAKERVILSACKQFFEAEGGVPISYVGYTYCLNQVTRGQIDDALSFNEHALIYHEQALMIGQQIYPDGHPNLVMSQGSVERARARLDNKAELNSELTSESKRDAQLQEHVNIALGYSINGG